MGRLVALPHSSLALVCSALQGAAAGLHMAYGTWRDVSEGFSFEGPSCSLCDPEEGCSWYVGVSNQLLILK